MRRLAARHSLASMTKNSCDMSDLGQSAPVNPPVKPPVNNGENKKPYIDIDILIAEVKKHPSLYTKSNNDQLDKTGRQKEWEDVCQVLFSHWNTLCSRKKMERCKFLYFFLFSLL